MSILERMLDRAVSRPMVIEPMRPRHVGQIMAIERDAYPRPWSAKVFHDELRRGPRPAAATTSSRGAAARCVGYGGLMFVAAPAWPARRTSPTSPCIRDERRAGVATQLLSALAGAAIERGCTAWTLEVRATSHGAQALYRRFGFVPGRRAQALLRERHRRHRHVVPRHPERRVRRPRAAARRSASEASGERRRRHRRRRRAPSCSASRRAATRPRRRSCSAATTSPRASSARRSTCTPRSAASSRRSPAGPTSTCSTR